jgi:hypothetical protein
MGGCEGVREGPLFLPSLPPPTLTHSHYLLAIEFNPDFLACWFYFDAVRHLCKKKSSDAGPTNQTKGNV